MSLFLIGGISTPEPGNPVQRVEGEVRSDLVRATIQRVRDDRLPQPRQQIIEAVISTAHLGGRGHQNKLACERLDDSAGGQLVTALSSGNEVAQDGVGGGRNDGQHIINVDAVHQFGAVMPIDLDGANLVPFIVEGVCGGEHQRCLFPRCVELTRHRPPPRCCRGCCRQDP